MGGETSGCKKNREGQPYDPKRGIKTKGGEKDGLAVFQKGSKKGTPNGLVRTERRIEQGRKKGEREA